MNVFVLVASQYSHEDREVWVEGNFDTEDLAKKHVSERPIIVNERPVEEGGRREWLADWHTGEDVYTGDIPPCSAACTKDFDVSGHASFDSEISWTITELPVRGSNS